MGSPTQAVFDPTAPYQSASTQPAQPSASPTPPSPAQKPAFDPNASYEPAPLPGVNVDKQWEPRPGDPLVRVRTSDGKNWELHQHDLEKLKQRDPGVKVFESYIHTPKEDSRSRTFQNWTSARAGQPMQNPEDQAEAEKGREAGTIEGGIAVATAPIGAALEMAAAPRVISKMVQTPGAKVATEQATGLIDTYGKPIIRTVLREGEPIMREIREEGASLLRQGAAKVTEMALKHKVTSGIVGLGVLKALGIHPAEVLKELIP